MSLVIVLWTIPRIRPFLEKLYCCRHNKYHPLSIQHKSSHGPTISVLYEYSNYLDIHSILSIVVYMKSKWVAPCVQILDTISNIIVDNLTGQTAHFEHHLYNTPSDAIFIVITNGSDAERLIYWYMIMGTRNSSCCGKLKPCLSKVVVWPHRPLARCIDRPLWNSYPPPATSGHTTTSSLTYNRWPQYSLQLIFKIIESVLLEFGGDRPSRCDEIGSQKADAIWIFLSASLLL